MIATLLATDNATLEAPEMPVTDTRRITEHDPDYQRIHRATVRHLRANLALYVRELRHDEPNADSRFIAHHIALMRDAYLQAHREGQRDYWHTVSLRKPPIAEADPAITRQRIAWYALSSVLKMAQEAKAALRQSQGAITQSEGQCGATVTTDAYRGNRPAVTHTGVMVAFMLKPSIARMLAVDGGEPASDMHITLAFLGDSTDMTEEQRRALPQAVADFARGAKPLFGRVKGVSRFKPGPHSEGKIPVIAEVGILGIQAWRRRLVAHLVKAGYPVDTTFKDYKPHITLAYAPDEAADAITSVPHAHLSLDALTVAIGDERHTYALGPTALSEVLLAGDGDPLAQWQASTDTRVDMQAAIGWSGIQDGYLAGGVGDPAAPFALLWWNLGWVKTDHCHDCPLLAAGSPYNRPGSGGNELDRTPGDGRTECGANCKCDLSYVPMAQRVEQTVAKAWGDYYASTQGGGSAVAYQPSNIEGYKAYGRIPIWEQGRFNQAMIAQLPNEPLIIPAQQTVGMAEKQALDRLRTARERWDDIRAVYPDLPEFPWYYSDDGTPHAVPQRYREFVDYAEVAAGLGRLWDANATWLSLQVAGDPTPEETDDTELAEDVLLGARGFFRAIGRAFGRGRASEGEHVGGGREYKRDREGKFDYDGGRKGHAKVTGTHEAIAEVQKRLGHGAMRSVTHEQIARLAGAGKGDHVEVDKYSMLHVTHSRDGSRSVVQVYDQLSGNADTHSERVNNWMHSDAEGNRTLSDPRDLARQVRAARELGVDSLTIRTTANVGMPHIHEWEAYPHMGYNATVDDALAIETTPHRMVPELERFRGRTLLDMLATPEGAMWWAENGLTPALHFDTAAGSQSVKQLNRLLADLRARGIDAGEDA